MRAPSGSFTSALDTARQYLHRCIIATGKDGTGALPPIRRMADEAGVSVATVRRAVTLAAADGQLVAVHGKGIFLPDTPPRPSTHHHPLRHERIADTLERDILGGIYAEFALLPSMKQLHARFGANYRTIRKAVALLADRGLVGADRPYPILTRTGPAARAGATLGFVARGQAQAQRFSPDSLSRVKVIEDWCTTHGTSVVPLFYYFLDGSRLVVNGQDANPFPQSLLRLIDLGHVIHTAGLSAVDLTALFETLNRTGLPVAVIDLHELITPSSLPRHRPNIRVFIPTSQRDAGRAVGMHLARTGARRAVYVSPYHAQHWSRERLAGLEEICRMAGTGIALETCTMPDPADTSPGLEDLTQSEIDTLRTRMVDRALDRHNPHERLLADAVLDMLPAFSEHLDEERLRQASLALFAQLPTLTPDTTLVCANDRVARFYCQYRRDIAQTRALPPTIIGFDNSFPATYHRFSSYSFNEQALFASALSFVRHPQAWRERGVFVRVDGRLAVR